MYLLVVILIIINTLYCIFDIISLKIRIDVIEYMFCVCAVILIIKHLIDNLYLTNNDYLKFENAESQKI